MKIVNWLGFAALPENTMYAKLDHSVDFGEVRIKGKTILNDNSNPIDYFYSEFLHEPESNDSIEAMDILEDGAESGESFPLEECLCRDGCFDLDQKYAIYEQKDINMIQKCISTTVKLPDGESPISELHTVQSGTLVILRNINGVSTFTQHGDADSVNSKLSTLDNDEDVQVIEIGYYRDVPEVMKLTIGGRFNG